MPLRTIKPTAAAHQIDRAFVTVNKFGFSFNSQFSKSQMIKPGSYVRIQVDDDERAVYFEFIKNSETANIEDCFAVNKNGGRKSKNVNGTRVEVRQLMTESNWIARIGILKNSSARRFSPKRFGSKWKISLRSSFENAIEKTGSAPDKVGVYRLIHNGEVVYIGEGRLRDRLAEHRSGNRMAFDRFEFSVVASKEIAESDENYWLEQFKTENNHYPKYNSHGGKRSSAA